VTLLIVGQEVQPTGMARVLRAIATGLSKEMSVSVLAIDRFVDHVSCKPSIAPYANVKIYGNPFHHDVFGEAMLQLLTRQLKPSHVILYQDVWHIQRYQEAITKSGVSTNVVAYCPLDGEIIDESGFRHLADAEAIVTVSPFSQKALKKLPCLSTQKDRIHVIAHGLEVSEFSGGLETSNRKPYKQALFPARPDVWDCPIILNANRHQSRKRLQDSLIGFAKFRERHELKTFLYLHWGHERTGANLKALAADYGVEDCVLWRTDATGFVNDKIKMVYGASDIGINTSLGEGWGLISFEHAATGAPQILPAHSACKDQWDNHGLLLDQLTPIQHNRYLEGQKIDPSQLADHLQLLCENTPLFTEYATKASELIMNEKYQWKCIIDQWHTLIKSIRIKGF